MGMVRKIALGLLTLLAVSTGAVKIAQLPEEMALFRHLGWSDGLTVAFGVVQLGAGVLLVPPRTRRLGAGVLIPTFLIATYALFANAVYPFAPLSLLFVAMAGLQLWPDKAS